MLPTAVGCMQEWPGGGRQWAILVESVICRVVWLFRPGQHYFSNSAADLHLRKQPGNCHVSMQVVRELPFPVKLPRRKENDSFIICSSFCSFSSDNATILDAFVLDHCFKPTTRELAIHFDSFFGELEIAAVS